MNFFTGLIITLFLFASTWEACHNHWLKASFYLLSALINLVVVYL